MVRNYIPTFIDVGPNVEHRTLSILQFERLSQMGRLLDQRSGDFLTTYIKYAFFGNDLFINADLMLMNSPLTSGYL